MELLLFVALDATVKIVAGVFIAKRAGGNHKPRGGRRARLPQITFRLPTLAPGMVR
jgi:hypothetical protein